MAYITCPNKKEALKIAHAIIEEKLVACANIIDSVTSVYEWEGKIQQESEVILIAKTKNELFDQVKSRIEKIHSYDCPCIVRLPIDGGTEAFINWIKSSTK